jgi:hypothetical protein
MMAMVDGCCMRLQLSLTRGRFGGKAIYGSAESLESSRVESNHINGYILSLESTIGVGHKDHDNGAPVPPDNDSVGGGSEVPLIRGQS